MRPTSTANNSFLNTATQPPPPQVPPQVPTSSMITEMTKKEGAMSKSIYSTTTDLRKKALDPAATYPFGGPSSASVPPYQIDATGTLGQPSASGRSSFGGPSTTTSSGFGESPAQCMRPYLFGSQPEASFTFGETSANNPLGAASASLSANSSAPFPNLIRGKSIFSKHLLIF